MNTTAASGTVLTQVSGRSTKACGLVIAVAGLGYFVDIYDLLLFTIVRTASLRGIGVPNSDLLSTGVVLLNMQMAGFAGRRHPVGGPRRQAGPVISPLRLDPRV